MFRIPDLIKDYDLHNFFNSDETGLLFRAIPDKKLAVKGSKFIGGMLSKECTTIMLCLIAVGDKEKPLVFSKTDMSTIGVHWYANKKSWIFIFQDWLRKFNDKMKDKDRKIIILLDYATCHKYNSELSHLKLFLPANTSSKLQSLDQGLINRLKFFIIAVFYSLYFCLFYIINIVFHDENSLNTRLNTFVDLIFNHISNIQLTLS